jgi:hypothetical protein
MFRLFQQAAVSPQTRSFSTIMTGLTLQDILDQHDNSDVIKMLIEKDNLVFVGAHFVHIRVSPSFVTCCVCNFDFLFVCRNDQEMMMSMVLKD